ncbi:MAG TPA: hypothetical protein VF290_25665 [Pyrinomonadaceae bacterium]
MKKIIVLTLVLGLFCFSAWPVSAQDQPTAQPSTEELEKEKAEREKNAYHLLDLVVDEAQSLRLTENRVRVQINAADMLWDQNQGRARSLFSLAAEGIGELGRNQANQRFQPGRNEGPPSPSMRIFQLRQELVMAAGKHDAALAYQMLAATKPPVSVQPATEQRGPRPNMTTDENLEQQLLARIASLDPKLAAQNAEQMIEKGQLPASIAEVINQLRRQDPDAAEKLADKTVKKLQATNLLTNPEAGGLVQTLLRLGPLTNSEPRSGRSPILEPPAYIELLTTVVDVALKATPQGQRIQAPQRGRPPNPTVPRQTGALTDAQIEQNNARRLLAGLQIVLPMVDQYLPTKAPALRQKMTEVGMPALPMNMGATPGSSPTNPTTDALVQAAATAPQQMQARLYQQAAYKAIEEGDTERARQIANDHLQPNMRDNVISRIDFREIAKKAEGARIEDVRQAVARLQTDNQKIDFLIQLAKEAQKTDEKQALQLLEDARQITNRRPTAYEHFEQQLRVSRAYSTIDPGRSFEMLDPGINQLNELLAAAAVLSGFEISMFRDGEMAIQPGGNGLTQMVNRFGQELAQLATIDFERSQTLAGRFQFPEARIMTRLAIVQGLIGARRLGPRGTAENVIIRQD